MAGLGLIKTTLLDYPGEVAAMLFFHGCNLRCPYCHNPDLVSGTEPADFLGIEEVLAFLRRRSRVLGGVVISGGEPLLHKELHGLVRAIRDLGLKVKVDTNGSLPEALDTLEADYVSLDLKTSPGKYPGLLGAPPGTEDRLFASVELVKARFPVHEFRTTLAPGIVEWEDLLVLADLVGPSSRWVLAQYRPGRTLDPACNEREPRPAQELITWIEELGSRGMNCSLRLHTSTGISGEGT